MRIDNIDNRGYYITEDGIRYLYSDGELRVGVNAEDAGNATPFWPSIKEADKYLRYWQNPTCDWSIEVNTDWWQTSCGNEWTMLSGTPTENGMKYCPMCGKKLVESISR